GRQETDAIEFKAAIPWHKNTFVKDILAIANVINGGSIIVGVEDETFARQGVGEDLMATYNVDKMRDQIAPFADPRVIFTKQIMEDRQGLSYVVIEVSSFDDIPVICARDGLDVQRGVIYYRSRARRPESARISNTADMRDVIEASIARRTRQLRRIGFTAEPGEQYDFDAELGGL
ncbi:MAG: ATP-binding protein, partial [Lentilitoribacter sp.]